MKPSSLLEHAPADAPAEAPTIAITPLAPAEASPACLLAEGTLRAIGAPVLGSGVCPDTMRCVAQGCQGLC